MVNALTINELSRQYLDDQESTEAIQYLRSLVDDPQDVNSLQAKYAVVPLYTQSKDAVNAQTVLNQIPQNDQEQIQYCALNQVCIDLVRNGKTVFDISAAQEQTIRDIAATSTQASRNAQALLTLVFQEQFPEEIDPIIFNQSQKRVEEPNDDALEVAEESTLKVYPNPASDKLNIDVYIPEKNQNAAFYVYDLTGNEMSTFTLEHGQNSIQLNCNTWNDGVYIYTLHLDGKVVERDKVSIIK